MKIKVFIKNKNNKVEFTQNELQSLLDETYNEGYTDGIKNNTRFPMYTTYPYVVTTSTSNDLKEILEEEYVNEIN